MSRSPTTLPLLTYRAATGLLEPLAPTLLRRRARGGREDPARLDERLGRPTAARGPGSLVWLHGVSVGESLSLLPLIESLQARRPDLRLLVTSGTVTSARLLATRLPDGVQHQYAPIDGPRAVRRFLDHWRPDIGVLVESELWPNLVTAARARGVRLALLSARMTAASARGWSRAPASAEALLSAFDLVAPQDEGTAQRLAALGARVGPRLNLKRVGSPLPHDAAALVQLRAAAGDRPIVLGASTHPGEEALVRRATPPDALLVVAPRHPDRGLRLASELGPGVARRSAGDPLTSQTRTYLADTLGELGLFYSLADLVVLGGGFAEGVGGHNPLEAARLGRAVITGPSVFNAADVYAEMRSEACTLVAADEAELTRHLAGLIAHQHIARRMGEAAQRYAERQARTLDAALAALAPLLPA